MIVIRHSFVCARPPKGARTRAALRAARAVAVGSAIGHIKYIQHRPGKDRDEKGRELFSDREESKDPRVLRQIVRDHRGQGVVIHKLTLAPEVRPEDPEAFTREVMNRLASEKGVNLQWWAVCHRNTDHHHIHVVVLPKDPNGRQVRFDRNDYDLMKEYGDTYLERTQFYDCRVAELKREEKRKQTEKEKERLRQERIFNGEELPRLHRKIVREQLEPYSEWIKRQANDTRASFEFQGQKYTHDDKLERLIALQTSLVGKSKREEKLTKEDYALLTRWIEIKDRAFYAGAIERQFNNANRAYNASMKRANSPNTHRYVPRAQQEMMRNPVMGLFFATASLAAEVVRSIPLTEGGGMNEDDGKKKRKKDKDRDLDNMG